MVFSFNSKLPWICFFFLLLQFFIVFSSSLTNTLFRINVCIRLRFFAGSFGCFRWWFCCAALSETSSLRRDDIILNRILPKRFIVILKTDRFRHFIKNYLRNNRCSWFCTGSTYLNQRLLPSRWSSWNSRSVFKLTYSIIIRIKCHTWHTAKIIFIFKDFTRNMVENWLAHHARMSVWISKAFLLNFIIVIICWTSNKTCLPTSCSAPKHAGIALRWISETLLRNQKAIIPWSIQKTYLWNSSLILLNAVSWNITWSYHTIILSEEGILFVVVAYITTE